MQNTKLLPYDTFHYKHHSYNLLKTKNNDYVKLMKNGKTAEQAVVKLETSKPPPKRDENHHYTQQLWKQRQMSSFKNFLHWYNKKYAVTTLEAMQKWLLFTTTKISLCWSLDVH